MYTSLSTVRPEEKHFAHECDNINNGFVPGRSTFQLYHDWVVTPWENCDLNETLCVDNEEIAKVWTFRYLGVILDEKCHFNGHATVVLNKDNEL
ncbi:unnamed protein product [Allacma fusca]|uniref:Uncharacterized protein n=1 Tax=Allacma fusca TaxID=39272 RepID=A0A8J2P1B7_9HEXA|nr:unnamed protein product [Allacma fusca]